jgi:hypothetical protein
MMISKMTGKILPLSIYLLENCSLVSISLRMFHRLLPKTGQNQRYLLYIYHFPIAHTHPAPRCLPWGGQLPQWETYRLFYQEHKQREEQGHRIYRNQEGRRGKVGNRTRTKLRLSPVKRGWYTDARCQSGWCRWRKHTTSVAALQQEAASLRTQPNTRLWD